MQENICRIPVTATFSIINGKAVMTAAEYADIPAADTDSSPLSSIQWSMSIAPRLPNRPTPIPLYGCLASMLFPRAISAAEKAEKLPGSVLFARFPFDKARYRINNQQAGLEVYIAGATNKYVTGRACPSGQGYGSSRMPGYCTAPGQPQNGIYSWKRPRNGRKWERDDHKATAWALKLSARMLEEAQKETRDALHQQAEAKARYAAWSASERDL